MPKVNFEFDSSQLLEQSLDIVLQSMYIHLKTFETHKMFLNIT